MMLWVWRRLGAMVVRRLFNVDGFTRNIWWQADNLGEVGGKVERPEVPTEPRTHRQDCKKVQHKVVANGELVSPAGSSRYLLSGRAAAGVEEIQEVEAAPAVDVKREEPADDVKNTQTQEQVVVLKVSLHCKACEGKVKKHLSKMAGVTSFSIDFAAKKVTVVGNVTPLGVLNSVSKVKNAQFWASQPAIAA